MRRFLHSIFTTFFAPVQKDEDIRNREVVLNVLLAGTLLILGLAILVIVGYYLKGRVFVVPRAVALSLIFIFVLGIYRLSRLGKYRLAAWLLVGIYFLLAAAVGLIWSISLPSAGLLYGLAVVLAGILLGPRYSLIGFGIAVTMITATVVLESAGIISYDLAWREMGPAADDIFGLSFMLGMIAAVSWLFNYQTARSLKRARRAEAALKKQKDLLEITVEKRTKELEATQLEKVKQMYRFAELGQLSTALLHDLANHLSTLTLDIEGLKGQTRSRALTRIKRSINYIDDMVLRVRDQLQGHGRTRTFNVATEIEKIVTMLHYRAAAKRVSLNLQMPDGKTSLKCSGEPVRLRQLMANLITNAIDAYEDMPPGAKREVSITTKSKSGSIIITVSDWGKGIPEAERSRLFKPFFSTKDSGMGMGLYITKQIAEEHFLGSVALDETKDHTLFKVALPGAN
jgi:signal transduction histidine kinase